MDIGEMDMPTGLVIFQDDNWDKGKCYSGGCLSNLKARRGLCIVRMTSCGLGKRNTLRTVAKMAINGGPSTMGVEWKAEVPVTAKIEVGIGKGRLARMRPKPDRYRRGRR